MVSPRNWQSFLRLPSTAAACAITMVTLEQISRKVRPAVKLMPRDGSWSAGLSGQVRAPPRRMP